MKFMGYDTFKIRWVGYILMCVLAALAGSLYAINYGFVNPSITEPARSAEVLVATLLGGARKCFRALLRHARVSGPQGPGKLFFYTLGIGSRSLHNHRLLLL